MPDSAIVLLAVGPLPTNDWLLRVQGVLSAVGMCVERQRSELLVWKDRRRFGNISYADALSVRRIWLAPGRGALGVTSRRLYFLDHGADIDRRPEHIVVSGIRPRSPAATEQMESQWALVQALKEGLHPPTSPIMLEKIDVELGVARLVRIGAHAYISPPAKLNTLYREHGFDLPPSGFMDFPRFRRQPSGLV